MLRQVVKQFFKFMPTKNVMLRLTHVLETEKLKAQNWDNGDAENNGEAWLLGRMAKDCRVVCDVGANAGDWTRSLLKLNPLTRVYAFEASPRTAAIFEKNLEGQANVQLFKMGLGEKHSTLTLHDYGVGSGLTSFISRADSIGLKPEKTYDVPCERLDGIEELKGQTIDFLKIDTEGFEVPVLKGAAQLLAAKKIKLIQFEYGGTWIDSRHFFLEAYTFLGANGMAVGRLLPRGVEWVTAYDSKVIENFRYANFIACTPEVAALLRGSN